MTGHLTQAAWERGQDGGGGEDAPRRKGARVAAVRKRNEAYYLRGEAYTAVTKILGDVLNKPALVRWAAIGAASNVLEDPETYNTAEKAYRGIYKVRDEAADRGSTVHSLVEAIAQGGDVKVDSLPESWRGYGQAFVEFDKVWRPEFSHTEINVYNSTLRYAGTSDAVARLADGYTYLLDWKTSKGIYLEAHLQLAAYRNCEFWLPKGVPTPAARPMPEVDRTAVVLFRRDGTFEFKRTDAPFEVFQAVLCVFRWQNLMKEAA